MGVKNEDIDSIVMRHASQMSYSTARDIIRILKEMSGSGHITLLKIVGDVVESETPKDSPQEFKQHSITTDGHKLQSLAKKYSKSE